MTPKVFALGTLKLGIFLYQMGRLGEQGGGEGVAGFVFRAMLR